MKLIEFAAPDRTGRINGYGDELTSRECGVEIRLIEACDPPYGETPVIGSNTSLPGAFKSVPFAIDGFLRRGTFCSQPDDLAWFGRAFQDELDYILGWMFTIAHAAGSESWIGDNNVQSVALAGNTAAQRVAGIMAARKLWRHTVVTVGGPVLHLPPSWAPDMKAAGLLENPDLTITGDPVVISDGYDEKGIAFWTGPVQIKLGKLSDEKVTKFRTNDEVNVLDTFAQIIVSPCSIVRVGAYA
jgi:hypothetical protein